MRPGDRLGHAYEHRAGAASEPLPPGYRPRKPETTALYQIVGGHLETFLADACERSEHGYGLPRFVERTFERYLDCGVLGRGFCRVRCQTPGCGYEMLLPFSCKARGVCPSCEGRRMADSAAHLVDRVLPQIPYRQWTMSFPRRVRFQLARSGTLLSQVLRAFLRTVFAWQRRRARKRGIADGKTGAVTFVQRMGSFANLNTHFHATLPDGVFSVGEDGSASFHALAPPSDEEVDKLTIQIIRRVAKILARHQADSDTDEVADALACAQAASVHALPAATGPCDQHRTGHRPAEATTRSRPTRCALIEGFSLHANVRIHENDRLGLERLLRYGARPPIAHNRLSLTADGRVSYRFRRRAPSGATEWVGSPVDFLSRLATLIPPPRQNTLRYHGLFAPNSKLRSLIVPRASSAPAATPSHTRPAPAATEHPAPISPLFESSASPPSGDATKAGRDPSTPAQAAAAPADPEPLPATILARSLDWAALLERVFDVDVTRCPRCHGKLRVIAFITHLDVARRILEHLRLPADAPPIAPARAPPQTAFADRLGRSW